MGKKNHTAIYVGLILAIAVLSVIALILVILIGVMGRQQQGGSELETSSNAWESYEGEENQETEPVQENISDGQETEDQPEEVQLEGSTESDEIPVIDSEFVFAGKDHWLFYKSTQDGDTMADYYGQNDFSEAQMKKIAASLEAQAAMIEEQGAKFVLLIVPNKEVVYDRYMADDARREADALSRTDKLVAYLQENTDLEIIYVKDTFLGMKDGEELLYYKTDTHWNMRGCYVAVHEIMQQLYGKSRPIEEISFQEHMYDFAGDLVAKANLGAEYKVDTVYFLGADQVAEEDKVDDTLLLVGDSFAEFMKMEMDYFFRGGVTDGNVERYNYNFYSATKSNLNSDTDVVVWECCERHVVRLGKE